MKGDFKSNGGKGLFRRTFSDEVATKPETKVVRNNRESTEAMRPVAVATALGGQRFRGDA